MADLSKRARVDAALRGEAVDRVPVSAWRHFIPDERDPESLAAASLDHFSHFDWDWLKVNPRAVYYAEAWGAQYDYAHYDSVLPQLIETPLHDPADLEKIVPINPTTGVFGENLELLKLIKAGIGHAHFLQTVFSPLSVLSFLTARPHTAKIDDMTQSAYEGIRRFLRENPQGAHAALQNITDTLAAYGKVAVDAGASGLFFAIVKLAREGILTEAEFAEFGKPYDQQVLAAVQGASFNMLHICGPYTYFDAVTNYPVQAINWATIGQHNPTVGEAAAHTDKALVGGVDEVGTLQTGTPEQVMVEAQAAIRAVGRRHLLLTPGCGTASDVPDANLHALRAAADITI